MISKNEALKIAQQECISRGLPWSDNIRVKWGIINYTVWGGGRKGGNLCVVIRKKDGYVLSCSTSPR